MPELRPYQLRAVDALREAVALGDSVLATAPTGSGKTTILCEVMRLASLRGKRSLFLCDREELIANTVHELHTFGLRCGAIKAGRPESRDLLIQVASVQTLRRRDRPPADIVICDEADLFIAPTYKALVDAYPDAVRIGATATPMRLDGRGLGAVFSKLVVVATTQELLNDGYIVEPTYYSHPTADLKGVHVRRGDYAADELASRMTSIVGDTVTHWLRLARGRPTLGFAVNRAHAQMQAEAFRSAGIQTAYVDADTPAFERARAIDSIRTQVIWNVGLFGRGTNIPELECVIDAAPTLSFAKFRQRIGRLTRPGKPQPIYLDHAGNILRHGPIHDEPVWSLSDRVKHTRPAPIQRCRECFIVIDPPKALCPNCGAHLAIPRPALPATKAGDLTAFEAKALSTFELRCATVLARHLANCSAKGYKPGYAKFLYHKEFGFYPTTRVIRAANERVRSAALDPGLVSQAP